MQIRKTLAALFCLLAGIDDTAALEDAGTLAQLSAASQAQDEDDFESFKQEFNKQYDSEQEESAREAIFEENQATVEQLNLQSQANGSSAVFAVNNSGDMTTEEWERSVGLRQ